MKLRNCYETGMHIRFENKVAMKDSSSLKSHFSCLVVKKRNMSKIKDNLLFSKKYFLHLKEKKKKII